MRKHNNTHPEDKPPVFRTWAGWYWLTLGLLLIQIAFYYLLTRMFG